MDVKYPHIKVQLTGGTDNAFGIIGAVKEALRKAGVPKVDIAQFQDEATSGDYDHLLQTCMRWVDVS